MAIPVVHRKVFDSVDRMFGKFLGLAGCCKGLEVGRQHRAPVDAHLPRTALVGKKDDVVPAFIDMTQKRQDQIEAFAGLFMISGV